MDLLQLIESTQFDHSKNVARLCRLLAERAGYSAEETSLIGMLALFHDVGKTGIPTEILNKPGPLTPEEYDVVKTHIIIGRDKIQSVAELLMIAARTAYEHHERIDGNGYLHLTESEIHPYSKLIAICDVFDALYSRRAYKSQWAIDDISEYFRAQTGKHFDGSLVSIFFGALDEILKLYAPPVPIVV